MPRPQQGKDTGDCGDVSTLIAPSSTGQELFATFQRGKKPDARGWFLKPARHEYSCRRNCKQAKPDYIDFKQRWIDEMADQNTPQKVDPSMVAEIVASYVTQNSIGVDQIAGLIATVHCTLSNLGTNAPEPLAAEALTPAVPIRRSVQPDYVVCLECGFRGQMLRRHLRVAHGLEPAAYRARWRLSADHALVAPVYSGRRSTMAKQLGLGRKRAEAETSVPVRRGRPRQAATE